MCNKSFIESRTRQSRNLVTVFLGMLLLIAQSLSAEGKKYELFSYGKTTYSIVVQSQAPDTEKEAAKELHEYLKEISGVDFPIKEKGQVGKRIIVGYNDIVKNLAPTRPNYEPLDESFSIFNVKGDIVIYGGSIKGTLYGVYDFLERDFGCKWYTKDIKKIPTKKSWSYNSIDRSMEPTFKVRNVYFRSILDKAWVKHSRNSGDEMYWGCHTFKTLIPAEKFFSKHPEYFSLRDGKRKADAQLCLSNPALVKICADALKEVIQAHPNCLVYDVSQNDNQFPCQCKKCQAIVKVEGSEAGPIIRFVNQVADIITKEYPDKYIGTFAYTYSRTAPQHVRPRENVVVRLCDGECCFSHSIEQCEVNQRFLSDLQAWSKITNNLMIWDYVTPVREYLLPYPNFSVLQSNIQLFKKYGAIGVMEEGSYRSWLSDMSDLKTYLLTKLLWDENADVDALTNDFLKNVYGKAAPYILQYMNYMKSLVTPQMHISKNYYREDPLYSDEMIAYCRNLFAKAEAVAESQDVLDRIKNLRVPVDYLYVRKHTNQAKANGSFARFKQYTEKKKINWVNRKTKMSEMLEGL